MNNFSVDFYVCSESMSCWTSYLRLSISFLAKATGFPAMISWYFVEFIVPLILSNSPGPLAAKPLQNINDPPLHYYITCHLAGAFIQSGLQLIRLSRRQTPWSNVGLRGLLKGQQLCRSYHGHTWDRTTDLAGLSQVAQPLRYRLPLTCMYSIFILHMSKVRMAKMFVCRTKECTSR